MVRLRGRAGYDLGKFMPYITVGLAHISDDDVSENGVFYGIGGEYLVNDQFSIGLEYSRTDFSDVDNVDGADANVDLIQIRGSYCF